MKWFLQEMATEAICRIAFYLTTHDKQALMTAATRYPSEIRNIIEGGKSTILQLLKNMRPFLNALNQGNPNIKSFPLQGINGKGFRDTKGDSAMWLDLCDEYFCSYIEEHDLFLRLKYNQLVAIKYSLASNSIIVEFQKDVLPKRFLSFLDIPVGFTPSLTFTLCSGGVSCQVLSCG
jgi:hypothetical protein